MDTPPQKKALASWQGPQDEGNNSLGMLLFILALGMFFAVGIVCFLLYRLTGSASAGMDALELPVALWLSSAVLALTTWSIQRALSTAQLGQIPLLSSWLKRTLFLAALFVVIQIPALMELLRVHQLYVSDGRAGIYGMTFALVLLHAVHVLGGMVPLSLLVWKAHKLRLQKENVSSVRFCALYWHFLGVVWLVLVVTLVWAG